MINCFRIALTHATPALDENLTRILPQTAVHMKDTRLGASTHHTLIQGIGLVLQNALQ